MQHKKTISRDFIWLLLAVFFSSIAVFSFAQNKEKEPVKVKIVKIVDGDTVTIEKIMDESNAQDLTKQFQNIKGKNVQVMVSVDDKDNVAKKEKQPTSMHFNINMDSAMANAFGKCFMFSDSAHCKKFVWHDSIMKNMPKDFDFKFDEGAFMKDFDFDFNIDTQEDGRTVTIKHKGGKTIVINGEEENTSITSSEDGKTKTSTKTIIVEDDKTKTRKKVIVTTSVVVIDMDEDEKGSGGRKSKDEHNFNFYPNPSDGNFVMDLDLNGKEDAQVRITDMNGKEVYNERFSGNGKTSKAISLGKDKKGTFIVTIKQGKRTSSKKIIIE